MPGSSELPGLHSRENHSMIVHFRAESKLEPVAEFELLRDSKIPEITAPDYYEPVRLTLSSSGKFLIPDRYVDTIHPEIEKSYKIHSFLGIEEFLTKAEFSEWKKYITFYHEDEPERKKSIWDIRSIVERKKVRRSCIL